MIGIILKFALGLIGIILTLVLFIIGVVKSDHNKFKQAGIVFFGACVTLLILGTIEFWILTSK